MINTLQIYEKEMTLPNSSAIIFNNQLKISYTAITQSVTSQFTLEDTLYPLALNL